MLSAFRQGHELIVLLALLADAAAKLAAILKR
jgi:hypothetical protein